MQQLAAMPSILSKPWGGSSFLSNLESSEAKNEVDLLLPNHSQDH